ncbi:hypothetical protein SAMN05660657_05657 [Geodermatophilus amargosae]|uniref:Uncharacterized protein n=1 Tax=Geodermatophilus amargosae TaxID=1296565 RepID=A0A1I7DDP2_9ACTN|nr:hypothetical protein [Geodermatophilus amargosae]SFU09841.1 hypothetical protein SAMN05660657_05657 [Geodermatophilus amargosae]
MSRGPNGAFALGIALTLAGMAALTALLTQVDEPTVAPVAGLALLAVAAALWITDLAWRLTTTVRIADASAGSPPPWCDPLAAWADAGLCYVAALSGGAAMARYGWAVARSGLLPRWSGCVTAALGLLLLAEFANTADVVPRPLHAAPLPVGVSVLIAARTTPGRTRSRGRRALGKREVHDPRGPPSGRDVGIGRCGHSSTGSPASAGAALSTQSASALAVTGRGTGDVASLAGPGCLRRIMSRDWRPDG